MKLYILTLESLSKSHQAVQAGHAVAAYLLKNPKTVWDNGTLVYLKVPSLEPWAQHADAVFHEPFWDNMLTAVAILGKSDLVKGLPLL